MILSENIKKVISIFRSTPRELSPEDEAVLKGVTIQDFFGEDVYAVETATYLLTVARFARDNASRWGLENLIPLEELLQVVEEAEDVKALRSLFKFDASYYSFEDTDSDDRCNAVPVAITVGNMRYYADVPVYRMIHIALSKNLADVFALCSVR